MYLYMYVSKLIKNLLFFHKLIIYYKIIVCIYICYIYNIIYITYEI